MPTGVLVVVLAVLTVSAGSGVSAAEAEADDNAGHEGRIDVETILNNPLDPSEYQDAERCISSRDYRRIEVLDEFNILFVGRRKTWLNRLRTRCAGSRR